MTKQEINERMDTMRRLTADTTVIFGFSDGKICVTALPSNTVTTFELNDVEQAVEHMDDLRVAGASRFYTSSSVDFPEEYGVTQDEADEVLKNVFGGE